ncbi:hypothetical protein VNI00_009668 [Paramarasmius palmivorus]|uniref:Uncharacterized protein n=1 Tax=Paramarasmius palmivorus TaxID=297713 RepID=A0AAW0CLJ8_9AGAR
MAGAGATDVPRDLWLQRSRLNGMILAAFVYGIFFLLSIQAWIAVRRGSQSSRTKLSKWQVRLLYAYIAVTFILGTMGFACNTRYTEDIWINFVGQRAPEDLIINEFDYWWNRMAIDSNFVMIWIMDLLLLYRCFVIWNYQIWVIGLMSTAYLGIIGLSIAVMHYAQMSAVFFNIKVQIAFLVLSCTFNLLFTVLVSTRLLGLRKQIIQSLGDEHAKTYTSVTATLVESAALYFVFDVIFVFAFGFKSNVQNLILLEYSSIQGIAELLIIVRVARGQDYDRTITTKTTRIDFHRQPNTTETGTRSLAFRPGHHGTTTMDDDDHVVLELPSARQHSTGQGSGGTDSNSREKEKDKDSDAEAKSMV